jgi:hypothetical protein
MTNHYWGESKFAEWLRGTPNPGPLSATGWREWRERAQAAHPIRYWLAEDGLDYLEDVVNYIPEKINDVRYYINNRWVTHAHALRAHPRDIVPGSWMDLGDRFLPCMFNELVNYVEVELAWHQVCWDDAARKKYRTPWWRTGWIRWRTWRCRQAGLDNLAWQKTCDNRDYTPEDDPNYGALTQQAYAAQEIEALYLWWTEERPLRPDPYEVSGWTAYCAEKHHAGEGLLESLDRPGHWETTKPMHDIMNELEAKYEQEDEEMMIRLIKIRNSLWT